MRFTHDDRTARKVARRLEKHLASKGVELALGQAMDAVAAMQGYADWNTLAAELSARKTPTELTIENEFIVYVEAWCLEEGPVNPPEWVRIRLTPALWQRLLTLRNIVREYQLVDLTERVEADGWGTSYPDPEDVKPGAGRLIVEDTCFAYETRMIGDNEPVTAAAIEFDKLREVLEGPVDAEALEYIRRGNTIVMCRGWHIIIRDLLSAGEKLDGFPPVEQLESLWDQVRTR